MAVAVEERVAMVRTFDRAQCEAGLRVRGLQVTGRRTLERRLRELAK